jgi:hypothetical protein
VTSNNESQESEQLKGNPFANLKWVLLGFTPSVAGLFLIAIRAQIPLLFVLLIILDIVLSAAATTGLTRDMKSYVKHAVVSFCLFWFFSVLNFIIVVSVSCSGHDHL